MVAAVLQNDACDDDDEHHHHNDDGGGDGDGDDDTATITTATTTTKTRMGNLFSISSCSATLGPRSAQIRPDQFESA